MKCSDYSTFLEAYAEHQKRCGADLAFTHISELVSLLQVAPTKTVLQFTRALNGADISTLPSKDSGLRANELATLHKFIRLFGKPAYVTDTELLEVALRPYARVDLESLRKEMAAVLGPKSKGAKKGKSPAPEPRIDVVIQYQRRLEESLGFDQGFKSVMAELESDSTLTAKELTLLSKRFSLKAAKSRPSALKNIWARHQNLLISQAKSDATAGRIAG